MPKRRAVLHGWVGARATSNGWRSWPASVNPLRWTVPGACSLVPTCAHGLPGTDFAEVVERKEGRAGRKVRGTHARERKAGILHGREIHVHGSRSLVARGAIHRGIADPAPFALDSSSYSSSIAASRCKPMTDRFGRAGVDAIVSRMFRCTKHGELAFSAERRLGIAHDKQKRAVAPAHASESINPDGAERAVRASCACGFGR